MSGLTWKARASVLMEVSLGIFSLALLWQVLLHPGLVYGASDNATCRLVLQAVSDELAPAASSLAGKAVAPHIVVVPRIVAGASELDAQALTRHGRIEVAARVCGYSEASKYALIAHEQGHFVAHAKFPIVEADAYAVDTKIGLLVHEAMADDYGARLLKWVARLNAAIVEMDVRCSPTRDGFSTLDVNVTTACQHLGAFQRANHE